jgi:hypothetical protein
VHLPDDQLFTDNAHVGRFVNDVVASMANNTDYSAVAASSSGADSSNGDDMQQASTSTAQCSNDASVQHDSSSVQQHQQQYTQLSQDDYGMSALYLTQDTEGTSNSQTDCTTDAAVDAHCTTSQQCSTNNSEEMNSKQLQHSRSGILWVNTDDTGAHQKACFVDVSVYSRNRCFRMLHSSKYGKTAKLRSVSMQYLIIPLLDNVTHEHCSCARLSQPGHLTAV